MGKMDALSLSLVYCCTLLLSAALFAPPGSITIASVIRYPYVNEKVNSDKRLPEHRYFTFSTAHPPRRGNPRSSVVV